MKKGMRMLLAGVLFAALAGCTGSPSPPAQPTETVTPSAPAKVFTDIAGHPQETYILEGLNEGFYRVPTDGLFRPDEPTTAAEFAEALRNLVRQTDGLDSGEAVLAEGDSEEVLPAVSWLETAGYAVPDVLIPDEPITRLDAIKILYVLNGKVSGPEALFTNIYNSAFLDSAEIPDDGKPAFYWGYYNVLIRETEPDTVAPFGTVSRGDMAEILVRYSEDFRSGPPVNEKEESMK